MSRKSFFEQQSAARRSTRTLVGMFLLAVVAVLVAVNLVVLVGLGVVDGSPEGRAVSDLGGPIFFTSLIVLAIIGGAVLIKQSQLRQGGSKVAEALGGTRVSEDTRDPQLRRLRNVVEEMAIASGVPVPAIYVLEREDGINAFAAGYTTSDAAIAVTRGTLDRLNREELQGVIAHEYSHILNGDMRLNIRLMGWLFGILVIAIVGQRLMLSASYSRNKNSGGLVAMGLALIAIGYIGVFFGHMIKAAVSRSREYLADASAVQFTRQTDGLAGALKKIAGVPQGSRLHTADAEDVSHMLFAHGLKSRMFATHPPVMKRIRALDPHFSPTAFKAEARQLANRYDGRNPQDDAPAVVSGFAGAEVAAAPVMAAALATPAAPVAVQPTVRDPLAQAGQLGVDHVQAARQLRASLPDSLTDTAHTPSGALAVLLALLLDEGSDIRDRQRAMIAAKLGEPVASAADTLRGQILMLHPLQRVPLAAIGLPALRRLPMARLHALRELIPELIHADGRIAMYEYAIGAMLETQLDDAMRPRRSRTQDKLELDQVGSEASLLLMVMADVGNDDAGRAAAAYNAGISHVLNAPAPYMRRKDWHLHLDDALQALDRLTPERKERLLNGLVATMRHNHQITADEYELLRATCATLHCPLPPLV